LVSLGDTPPRGVCRERSCHSFSREAPGPLLGGHRPRGVTGQADSSNERWLGRVVVWRGSGEECSQVVVEEDAVGIEFLTDRDEFGGLGIEGVKAVGGEEVQLAPVNAGVEL